MAQQMMNIILKEDREIDGIIRLKGTIVTLPDFIGKRLVASGVAVPSRIDPGIVTEKEETEEEEVEEEIEIESPEASDEETEDSTT